MSQDSCDDKHDKSLHPSSIIQIPSTGNTAPISQEQEPVSKSPIWKRLTFWNVIFNFILAITTAFLGMIAYWQLEATDKAIDTSQWANIISAESLAVSQSSFRTSAEALRMSKESSEEAERIFRLEQRAWIGTRSADITQFVPDKPARVKVVLTNTGRTPAIKAQTLFGIAISDKPITEAHVSAFDSGFDLVEHDVMTLIPYSLMPITQDSDVLTKQAHADIKSGKSIFYILGKVLYLDVFNRSHSTKFCLYYNPPTSSFSNCPIYNDAD